MKKRIILLFMMCLLTINVFGFISSLPDGTEYSPTQTITVAIATTTNPEKNAPYVVQWYNSSNILVETDAGLLSSGLVGSTVFQTYVSSINTNWTRAYVNITVGGVTQQLYFNVTGSAANFLTITDAAFSPQAKLGAAFAVDFRVEDDLGEAVDNARCEVFGTDVVGAPLQQCTVGGGTSISINGRGLCAGILDPVPFIEGEQYLAKIRCTCGIGDNACFDVSGNTIEKHSGGISYVFEVTPWLTVNTITDKLVYEVDDTIYVCANITSNNTERLSLDIIYNWRCQNGAGDQSTDRILLGNKMEQRGISSNKTQNQCNSFLVIDDLAIEQGAVNCYASTAVIVLDKNKNPVYTYDTTSPIFELTVDEINPFVRWTRISREVYMTAINIDEYDVGFKDIDVRVNKRLTGEDTPATMLKDYSVVFANGSAIPYDVEIQVVSTAITDNRINTLNIDKFDELSVTILNVNTTRDERFNITIEGLELQFELVEDTYNNSGQILNDTKTIQSTQTTILADIAAVASDVWNYIGRYIHGEII